MRQKEFEELVELEDPSKQRYINWVSVLVKGNTRGLQWVCEVYEKSNSWGTTIMECRRCLMDGGRGLVPDSDIELAYKIKDYKKLSELMSERFLEYIPKSKIITIVAELENEGFTITDLLARAKRRPRALIDCTRVGLMKRK